MNNKIKPWTELSRKTVYKKFGRAIEEVNFQLPNCSQHEVVIKREGPVVGCVAQTKDNKFLVVRQFRPGPMEFLYDMPGGKMEEGEDPEEIMKKELLEETGYMGDLQLVTKCYHEAYSTFYMYCFVATDCEKIGEVQDVADDFGENQKGFVQDIDLQLVDLDRFREILRSGMSTNVELAYLGLDYLGLL